MTWEQRPVRRQKVRYDDDNDDNPIYSQLLINGVKQTPDIGEGDDHLARITIYAPGNTTSLVGPVPMTVSGSLLLYSVDTTTEASWPIDTGYRAELAITCNAIVYHRVLLFDVVRFLLDLRIGFDELVALDDGIRGMGHDGQTDFRNVIVASRDLLQAKLEAKALKEKKLVESMILDHDTLANIARLYILGRIWWPKDRDRAQDYFAEFEPLWDAVLSNLKYDKEQSGEEDSEMGGIQEVRITT